MKEIQEMYTDAIQIGTSEYTLRLIIGSDVNGEFNPNIMLSMNPEFAREFYQTLGEALEHYQNSNEMLVSENQK
nr:hypothetical protein [uncultured Draconibacterium sp.]